MTYSTTDSLKRQRLDHLIKKIQIKRKKMGSYIITEHKRYNEGGFMEVKNI